MPNPPLISGLKTAFQTNLKTNKMKFILAILAFGLVESVKISAPRATHRMAAQVLKHCDTDKSNSLSLDEALACAQGKTKPEELKLLKEVWPKNEDGEF